MDILGLAVSAEDVEDMGRVKVRYLVPPELRSGHTAIVDGYVIEGHVPVEVINRLLRERPDFIGLAVAGMPAGSPGMEVEDAAAVPFDVIAFDGAGWQAVFAGYPDK